MSDRFAATEQGLQVYCGLLGLLVGSLFVFISSVLIIPALQPTEGLSPQAPQRIMLFPLILGLLALHAGWSLLWQLAYEVSFEGPDEIVFDSPFASRRGPTSGLIAIERTKVGRVSGVDPRELRITHERGVIHLRRVEDTEGFLVRLQAANPDIVIHGDWD